MSSQTVPDVLLPYLPGNTIVPSPTEQTEIFIQYLNRLYEDIAYNVNQRDLIAFPIAVTSDFQNIPNVPNSGAFIILISGQLSGMPSAIFGLTKAANNITGLWSKLQDQDGNTGVWAGHELIIQSTTTNFQIKHNLVTTPETVGNFNLRIVGTQ